MTNPEKGKMIIEERGKENPRIKGNGNREREEVIDDK